MRFTRLQSRHLRVDRTEHVMQRSPGMEAFQPRFTREGYLSFVRTLDQRVVYEPD